MSMNEAVVLGNICPNDPFELQTAQAPGNANLIVMVIVEGAPINTIVG